MRLPLIPSEWRGWWRRDPGRSALRALSCGVLAGLIVPGFIAAVPLSLDWPWRLALTAVLGVVCGVCLTVIGRPRD